MQQSAGSCCFSQGMCRHYVFVASAGAYKASNIEPMHVEGDERKASAGVTLVFRALCGRLAKQHLSSKHCSCIVAASFKRHML